MLADKTITRTQYVRITVLNKRINEAVKNLLDYYNKNKIDPNKIDVTLERPVVLPGTSVATPSSYFCPKTAWVDCEPSIANKPQCKPEYLRWAKKNCRGFQGSAQ